MSTTDWTAEGRDAVASAIGQSREKLGDLVLGLTQPTPAIFVASDHREFDNSGVAPATPETPEEDQTPAVDLIQERLAVMLA